jgi:pimeloyl-ACP methyl ester carboxylesterase
MRSWQVLLGSTAASAAIVAAAGLYGAAEVTRSRRSSHRDDPDAWGLPCREIEYSAPDGMRLKAWLAPTAESRAAIIVVHGHGGNRHTTLAHSALLYPEFTVLMPDLRAHGDSAGDLTSIGYRERLDLIGAARYLRALGYGPVGVLGVSMGGATAILAAAECPEIDAVVSDSSFACLRFAVREAARLRGYPGPITRPWANLSCLVAALRLRHHPQAADPVLAVAAIAPRPLLLIHGEADELILVEAAHALHRAAGEPKELWLLPHVAHARALESAPEAYRERVQDFFRRSLLAAGPTRVESGSGALQARALDVGQPAAQASPNQMDQVA